jgi:hypothetical protein
MKIAVYSPMKNEAENMAAWAMTAADADYRVIADMGGNGSPPIGVTHWAQTYIEPFRFDLGHNVALALVPEDADLCIPLHGDERLTGGWRKRIEAAWHERASRLRYHYQFQPGWTIMTDRAHARAGYHWRHCDHEAVYPYFDRKDFFAVVHGKEPLIVQTQDQNKDRSKILDRLKWAKVEDPNSARVAFYLGREFYFQGQMVHAIAELQRYYTLPGQWPGEQGDVAHYLSEAYKALSKGLPGTTRPAGRS